MRQKPFRENRHGCERFRPLCRRSAPRSLRLKSSKQQRVAPVISLELGKRCKLFFKQSGTACTKRLCLSEAFFYLPEKGVWEEWKQCCVY